MAVPDNDQSCWYINLGDKGFRLWSGNHGELFLASHQLSQKSGELFLIVIKHEPCGICVGGQRLSDLYVQAGVLRLMSIGRRITVACGWKLAYLRLIVFPRSFFFSFFVPQGCSDTSILKSDAFALPFLLCQQWRLCFHMEWQRSRGVWNLPEVHVMEALRKLVTVFDYIERDVQYHLFVCHCCQKLFNVKWPLICCTNLKISKYVDCQHLKFHNDAF